MNIRDLTEKLRAELADGASGDKAAHKLLAELRIRAREIESLKETIADQKDQIEALRQELKQSEFRNKTLERSYSTQLDAARARMHASERLTHEQTERIAELERSYKLTRRELDDARSRLDMFGPDAASIDEILAGAATAKDQPKQPVPVALADEPVDELQSLGEMLAPEVMFARRNKETV